MPSITRVGLVAKTRLDAAAGLLSELADWLETRGLQAVFEADTAAMVGLPKGRPRPTRDQLPAACDLIVVLGGDGTLIGMAGRIAEAGVDVPILGVNFGSLGFLTEITLDELSDSLQSVLDGTAHIDERMMLRSRTLRGAAVFSDRLALNDVVITKGALSRIIELGVEIGGQPVMRVRADGLIIASPTGSTAYNLAAGGPIIHPAVDALLITPIAPHMLTNRPIVVPGSAEIRIRPAMDGREAAPPASSRYDSRGDEVFVTFDGQSGHPLEPDDVISVHSAPRRLRLVRASTRSYFDVLRQKLKWSER